MTITMPSHLSDDELTAKVQALARGEQEATALLIAHLAEFDGRRLYLGAGCSSLFTYCCEILQLSSSITTSRMESVAKAPWRTSSFSVARTMRSRPSASTGMGVR